MFVRGGVRYELAGEPLFSLLCHCRDCQYQSGSAFLSRRCGCRQSGFRVTKGEPKLYVRGSDAGNEVRFGRFARRVRLTPVYSGFGAAGLLSDCGSAISTTRASFAPRPTSLVKSAQPWDHLNPDLPKYQTYPPGRAYNPATEG